MKRPPSFSEQLTALAHDRLSCDPVFWESSDKIGLVALLPKERLTELQAAISRQTIGAVVSVQEQEPKPGNRRAPLLLLAKLDVHCAENRTLNTSGTSGEYLAEAVAAALCAWAPSICEDFPVFEGISDVTADADADANRRIQRVRFGFVGASEIKPAETAAPVISIIDDQAVVVGPAGAVLRYTLDESRPTTTSPEYISPLALESGQTLTVRAWKAGERASLVATVTA